LEECALTEEFAELGDPAVEVIARHLVDSLPGSRKRAELFRLLSNTARYSPRAATVALETPFETLGREEAQQWVIVFANQRETSAELELIKAAAHTHWNVRLNSTKALRRLGTDKAVKRLNELASSDAHPLVRDFATRELDALRGGRGGE
jgi:HEAT repeat protein